LFGHLKTTHEKVDECFEAKMGHKFPHRFFKYKTAPDPVMDRGSLLSC
jgi:hypothetical protein